MPLSPKNQTLPLLSLPATCFGQGPEPLWEREWLVTNGLGGYASGTVACTGTRRYHGLLVSADPPPNARWVLVSGADVTASIDTVMYSLSTQEYPDGVLSPEGFHHLTGFSLSGQRPVWCWQVADAVIEQTLWMPYSQNRTYIRFDNRGAKTVKLYWRPFVTIRWFHALLRGDGANFTVDIEGTCGVRIRAPWEAPSVVIGGQGWLFQPSSDLYRNFVRRAESVRGFDAL